MPPDAGINLQWRLLLDTADERHGCWTITSKLSLGPPQRMTQSVSNPFNKVALVTVGAVYTMITALYSVL